MTGKVLLLVSSFCLFLLACKNTNKENLNVNNVESKILIDKSYNLIPELVNRVKAIDSILASSQPILLLKNLNQNEAIAQELAITCPDFQKYLTDPNTKTQFRNEIFNVYQARPQEVPEGYIKQNIYKVEMYNYVLNMTTTALVDVITKKVLVSGFFKDVQPDIPSHLKDLALKIAVGNPEVIAALGYKPNEKEALMANTKTALNNTKCERSLHLCVAPTFIKDDKALWVIVDLTDYKIVGLRWTQVGTTGEVPVISEKRLKFDKVMDCFCKEELTLNKDNWKFKYIITTSDGLRISEVKYKDNLIITSAKVVDWHVSYSNTDGFGYSDAVGCPEFSQAAVVAETEPRITDIIENGRKIGFALEQNFSSEQWPKPCNYNYLQRFEFYNDGRFRPAVASLGRGCGNNGTYRPVTRIAFAGNDNTFAEWSNNSWKPWEKEKWNLQTEITPYTKEGYQYKINSSANIGYYLQANTGSFNDGGRGDNAYVYVTKLHANKEEGERDLPTIGPCCNTDYKQGPEKFMTPQPDNIVKTNLVIWYVAQLKNDNTKGKEYCWAESKLVNGVYKTTTFPCLSGPFFVPFKK